MIKVICNEKDTYSFEDCFCYECNNTDCNVCKYAEENIIFDTHDNDNIIIETDIDELDIKTCIYNTPYNFRGCGIAKEGENCGKCRFWYENIEIQKI